MGPPWGAFCQITLTSCYASNNEENIGMQSLTVVPFPVGGCDTYINIVLWFIAYYKEWLVACGFVGWDVRQSQKLSHLLTVVLTEFILNWTSLNSYINVNVSSSCFLHCKVTVSSSVTSSLICMFVHPSIHTSICVSLNRTIEIVADDFLLLRCRF